MTVPQRYSGIQSILANCGSEGCHFLVLCSIIEEYTKCPLDLIDTILTCQSKGWLKSDFFVTDALAILRYYTQKSWIRTEVEKLPITIKTNQFTEAVYYNKKTGFTHFRRRGYDTIFDSNTVKNGKLIQYNIYETTE